MKIPTTAFLPLLLSILVSQGCGHGSRGSGGDADAADTLDDSQDGSGDSAGDTPEDLAGDEGDAAGDDGGWTYTEEREPCDDFDPLRQAFFGDLHAHTGLSFDAWSYDNRHVPAEAYAFARGEPIDLPPLDVDGQGTRSVTLARPLDFVMIADHAEFLGEMLLCTEPGHEAYDSPECVQLRDDPESAVVTFGIQTASTHPARLDICGSEAGCIGGAALERWLLVQEEAEEAYDRTAACGLVTFVGYEYTSTTSVSNNHRTVIFRNAVVPALPITIYEAIDEWALWQALADQCLDAGTGCEVMTSAHNTNLSNGRMFELEYGGAATLEEEAAMAGLRARIERLVEIFQHKGETECRNGFEGLAGDPDPLCAFEEQWPADAEDGGEGTGTGGMRLWGCVSRYDYAAWPSRGGSE